MSTSVVVPDASDRFQFAMYTDRSSSAVHRVDMEQGQPPEVTPRDRLAPFTSLCRFYAELGWFVVARDPRRLGWGVGALHFCARCAQRVQRLEATTNT